MPKNVTCTDCGATFTRNSTLKRHRQITHETEATEYVCPDCQKAFARKDFLTRHRNIHTGAGMTSCPRCGRDFRKDYFKRHLVSCQERFDRQSQSTSAKQTKFLPSTSSVQWDPVRTVSPSFVQAEEKPQRPVSFVRNALDTATPDIHDLDLSEDDVLFPAVQAAIATGNLNRLRVLVAASPPPCNTIRGLAKSYRQYAESFCWRLFESRFHSFTEDVRTCAARYGQVSIIKFLGESGLDLAREGLYDIPPLHWAARYGHDAAVEYLLNYGMDINAGEYWEGDTALDYAIKAKQKGTVKLLIRRRSQAFAWTEFHPLMTAIESGNLDMVRLLFELGVGVLQGNEEEESPLHWAVYFDQTGIIDFLLDIGANVNESVDSAYGTPLCFAAAECNHNAARTLIRRGALVNGIYGSFGTTPLMRVYGNNASLTQSMIDLLIANGANVNLCRPLSQSDPYTHTALTEACSGSSSRSDAVARLLLHGANPNLGRPPPLEKALRSGQGLETLRLLLKAEANLGLVSNSCLATLRAIDDGSLAIQDLDSSWRFCQHPAEKLRLLDEYMSNAVERRL